jgi:hypothetical protein
MPKIELVALAATGLLIFGGIFTTAPAFGEDDESDDNEQSSQSTPTPKIQSSSAEDSDDEDSEDESDESEESEIDESRETELKHQELEEKYGKDGHLSLPPLVIRPEGFTGPGRSTLVGGAGSYIGLGLGSATKSQSGAGYERPTETVIINPEKNIAIDISAVSSARKTPADVFIESATTGLFAMGFGAVGLGVVAGTRAIRRR